MEAIRIVQKPVNGVISFPVPDDMREETIVVDFRPARESDKQSLAEVSRAFFNKLQRPDPDFDWDTLNAYDQ